MELNVSGRYGKTMACNAWQNFVTHVSKQNLGVFHWNKTLDKELTCYRAKNLHGTEFILFENDADATFFMLRWS